MRDMLIIEHNSIRFKIPCGRVTENFLPCIAHAINAK